LINDTDDIRFLSFVEGADELLCFVEGSNDVDSIDGLGDMADQRGSAVGLKSFDLP
jgi:hypothetical protein